MAQPFPSVLAGRYSVLEGGWQSNGQNGRDFPFGELITDTGDYFLTSDGDILSFISF